MRTKSGITALVLATGFTLGLNAPAVAAPIDSFTNVFVTNNNEITTAPNAPNTTTTNTPGVGTAPSTSTRTATISQVSGGTPTGSVRSNASIDAVAKTLTLGNDGSLIAKVSLQYAFTAAQNFSSGNFTLNIVQNDGGVGDPGTNFTLTLTSASGSASASVSKANTGLLTFSSFAPTGSFNINAVTSLTLDVQPTAPGADLILGGNNGGIIFNNIQAIPEPASIATFSVLGVAGLVGYRFRRRKETATV